MTFCNDAKLLISVVRRGRGDKVVALAKSAGATGSTVFFGKGTAPQKILYLLCLADVEKEIVFTIASNEVMRSIIDLLRQAPDLCKKVPGIAITINVLDFLRSGSLKQHGQDSVANNIHDAQTILEKDNMTMNRQPDYKLICVIVNAGFADDIMQAARKAGATGGTIVKARGTGTEEDTSFFGITIVPEKEMLMILIKRESETPILNAIRACECLSQPGTGIIFCLPVEDFFMLGK